MKIELLFPDLCNLFGDNANPRYLRKCLPDAEFIETDLSQVPAFVEQNDINLIYMGPMTESMQEKVINKLREYKERIQELIQKGTCFLMTGNSLEVFGEFIENEDGSRIEGLGLYQTHAKRDMMNRFNGLMLGEFQDIPIVGFKSQFAQSYGENQENYFVKVTRGPGINKDSSYEGIKMNNFIATYVLGPILILNPLFTKYLLKQMGVEEPKLAFEEAVMAAYEQRLKEFQDETIKF